MRPVEYIRFLSERLCRANGIRRVEPELVDSLLVALSTFVAGNDPLRVSLTTAALDAIEEQNTITREVLDDHLRRALEIYLALPTPAPGEKVVHHRRPSMVGQRRQVLGHGKDSADAVVDRQEKESPDTT